MNEAQRGELYRAVAKAYMFSPKVGSQILRAQHPLTGEPFRLLACVEAAQELHMTVQLQKEGTFFCHLEQFNAKKGVRPMSKTTEAETNSDAVLLALAGALAVEVPA